MRQEISPINATRAFTLPELLIVVAVVAIVASVAFKLISSSTGSLNQSKLDHQVRQLNTAVKVYLSSGGSLEGIETAQDVINELKKAANASGQRKVVGLRGSMVDNGLEAVTESGGAASERAVWKAGEHKFVIETTTDGVVEFRLNKALAAVNYGEAERHTRLVYNSVDGWVWETSDYASSSDNGPSSVPVVQAPTLGARVGLGSANSAKLGTPIISPDSGVHALSLFPLQVSIAKHANDPPDAKIFFSKEPNVWQVYSSPFTVDVGASVQAYSSNEDPDWEDSDFATATFRTDPAALEIAINTPRNPITYVEAGGSLEPGDYTPIVADEPSIMVTLPGGYAIPDVYENSDQFQFYWTYDGSDPRTSPTRTRGITFSNGYKNKGNNGHGNNYSGTDVSNPAYIRWAAKNGVDLTGVVDDEMKPFDMIKYTLLQWQGASLMPIRVIAQSKNTRLVTNSAVMSSNIGIKRINLRAPKIVQAEDASRGDTVELQLEVDFGDMPTGTRIYYTTDGTDPGYDSAGNPLTGTLYTGPFDPLLGTDEFVGEAMIIARVYPPQQYANWFTVSNPSNSHYLVSTWEISGVATGWFGSSGGGLSDSRWDYMSGSHFEWSDALGLDGSSFEDISNRERFQIGQISYYNGGGFTSGNVGSFDFAVQLALDSSTSQFNYRINQFVTLNNGNEWESADFITFNDTLSTQSVSLYGVDYSLNLEFGESSSNGTTTADEFRVKEGSTATANLYGSLISLGSWW